MSENNYNSKALEFPEEEVEIEMDEKVGGSNKLTTLIGALVSLLAGFFLAVQGSIDGALSTPLHSEFAASTISFLGGVITLLLVFPFSLGQTKEQCNGKAIPWYLYIGGGAIGNINIVAVTFLGPKLGYSLFFVASLFGQLAGSLVVDHAGWWDMPTRRIYKMDFVAVALVFLGAVLSVYQNLQATGSPGLMVLYFVLSIFSGACTPIQVNMNTCLTKRLGTYPHRTALLSFSVGLVLISSIWGISVLANPQAPKPDFSAVPWWMFFGGTLGACYIFATIALIPAWVSIPLFFIAATAGQLAGSMLIDGLGLFNATKITITLLRYLGVVSVFIGVALSIAWPFIMRKREEKQNLKSELPLETIEIEQ